MLPLFVHSFFFLQTILFVIVRVYFLSNNSCHFLLLFLINLVALSFILFFLNFHYFFSRFAELLPRFIDKSVCIYVFFPDLLSLTYVQPFIIFLRFIINSYIMVYKNISSFSHQLPTSRSASPFIASPLHLPLHLPLPFLFS